MMPREVLGIILENIETCPPYLRILGENRRLMERLREARDDGVDLTRIIYLTRIEYQGISYISTIRNTPSTDTPCESLTIPSNASEIILSRDHMGIRNIQFLNMNSNPLEDGSQWYENIGLLGSPIGWCAHVQHDVRSSIRTVFLDMNAKFIRRVFSSETFALTQNIIWDFSKGAFGVLHAHLTFILRTSVPSASLIGFTMSHLTVALEALLYAARREGTSEFMLIPELQKSTTCLSGE